jgi:6-phosphofructokinase 1
VVAAAALDDVWLLLAALLVYGAGASTNLQARYAGADLAAPGRRGTAVSIVMVSTTLGAVAGPNLIAPMGEVAAALGIPELAGPFILAAGAYALAGLVLFALLRPDPLLVAMARGAGPAAAPEDPASLPAGSGATAGRGVVVGATMMVLTQIAMIAIMTMTPVHMTDHGHDLDAVGFVIGAHIAFMFLPSPITGMLADRYGRIPVAVAAAVILMAAGLVAALAPGDSLPALVVALALLGLGWNAGLIAGTALVVDSAPLASRARIQGRVDLLIALAGASGGAMSGVVVAGAGFAALALVGGALSLLLLPVLLWYRRPAGVAGPSAGTAARRAHVSRGRGTSPRPRAYIAPMRIGILTAGGDCPGLNAVIRAAGRKLIREGHEPVGLMRGYRGLAYRDHKILDHSSLSGLLPLGGTILSTSSYDPFRHDDGIALVTSAMERGDIDAVIAIGGEHTMEITRNLHAELGLPVVGVPKTIDNDIVGTDRTFGFATAVHVVTEALDRLHSTAQSHDRVIVVEVMGRHAGHIAVHSAIAGGADGVLVPEVDTTVEEVARTIRARHDRGKNFSLIVVSEGARLAFADGRTQSVRVHQDTDEYGYERLGGIGNALAAELEKATGYETRVVVLGHVQRGGTPTASDRVLSTRYGVAAAEAVLAGDTGTMVALRGNDIVTIPLAEVVGVKGVDLDLLELARTFF